MDNVPVLAWQDICWGEVSTGLEHTINTDMGKPCPINSIDKGNFVQRRHRFVFNAWLDCSILICCLNNKQKWAQFCASFLCTSLSFDSVMVSGTQFINLITQLKRLNKILLCIVCCLLTTSRWKNFRHRHSTQKCKTSLFKRWKNFRHRHSINAKTLLFKLNQVN